MSISAILVSLALLVPSTPQPVEKTFNQVMSLHPAYQEEVLFDRGVLSKDLLARGARILARLSRNALDPVSVIDRGIRFDYENSVSPEELAEIMYEKGLNQPTSYGGPLVVLAIARHETGYRNARGDQHLDPLGYGISCGLTQIRTDYPGRPTCKELMIDPGKALEWSHTKLESLMLSSSCVDHGRCASRYAGAGPKALAFQRWLADTATYTYEHLAEELAYKECLPLSDPSSRLAAL